MQKWEYRILYTPDIKEIEHGMKVRELEINQMGEAGWDLVAATDYTIYFKRPKY